MSSAEAGKLMLNGGPHLKPAHHVGDSGYYGVLLNHFLTVLSILQF